MNGDSLVNSFSKADAHPRDDEADDSQAESETPSDTTHNGDLALDPKAHVSSEFVERRKKSRENSGCGGWDWTEALAGFRVQVTQWAYQCRIVRDKLGHLDKVQGTRGSKVGSSMCAHTHVASLVTRRSMSTFL